MSKHCGQGIDVGYSNLKGKGDNAEGAGKFEMLVPVGCAPAALLGQSLVGGSEKGIRVLVDGEEYVAGVTPDRFDKHVRDLHAEYTSSKSYRGLCHAALLQSGNDVIDDLVTGLPVNQFKQKKLREALRDQLQGEHEVAQGKVVTVKNVSVVPQPAGGFMDMIRRAGPIAESLTSSSVLVVDPGFYSVDWVLVDRGDYRADSCGTSTQASSVVLEAAVELIYETFGKRTSVDRLEDEVRKSKPSFLVGGTSVEVAPILDAASRKVAPLVINEMRQKLRSEGVDSDCILLVGGGAKFYEQQIKEIYGEEKVLIANDPVMANARGFWAISKSSVS